MREIKFRAWDKKENSMSCFYGFTLNTDEELKAHIDCIVMQFTGLTDKNGKEIYEGDIMRYTIGEQSSVSFVVWSLDGWRFNSYMVGGSMGLYDCVSANPRKHEKAEIIGNMYESPELLNN